jgi:hypothetical protein
MRSNLPVTQNEIKLTDATLIVSKTDLQGRICPCPMRARARPSESEFRYSVFSRTGQSPIAMSPCLDSISATPQLPRYQKSRRTPS